MALTAKPISTISYNTEQFIIRKLDQMFKANIITDYRYICHQGEDGDKDHIHLMMWPNKRLDTGALREEFIEVPQGANKDDKPLGVMPFRQSKTDHWLMYVIHDAEYLKNHQSDNDGDGKIPYDISDVKTPFPEQLARDFKKAIALRKTQNQEILERLNKHESATRIMYETGFNPMTVMTIMKAVEIEQGMREILAQEKAKQEQLAQMQKAATLTGEVKMIEEMPQLKAEYDKGIFTQKVETFHMNTATGELVSDGVKFEQVKEEDDDHGLWEGLENDETR